MNFPRICYYSNEKEIWPNKALQILLLLLLGSAQKLVNSWPAHPQYWSQEQYYCRTPYRSSPLLLSKVVNFQLGKSEINKETCHKVPKVTNLVIFGFSTLLLSLLSGGRYFRMAKTFTPHGHFKNKIAKNMKGILFEKR